MSSITKIPYSDLSEEQQKKYNSKFERLTVFGKILTALGVIISWVEMPDVKIDGVQQYRFCSKFVKWHPLFWVVAIFVLLFLIIKGVGQSIYYYFCNNSVDLWNTQRHNF